MDEDEADRYAGKSGVFETLESGESASATGPQKCESSPIRL